LEDLPFIDGYNDYINNPGMYNLDKDYKQMYMPRKDKVYSLETCCFIPAIENSRIMSLENAKRKYIGVKPIGPMLFRSSICIRGRMINLGTYDSEELAAVAYNNALEYFHPKSFIKNNVSTMSPSELINFNLSKKEMCKIIS
jgi:hypothetical protein